MSEYADWRAGPHVDRRRSSGLVLRACPRPGVRARVLPAWVRSPGKKPERFSCHPGAAGEGKAGRANVSEPSMTPRYLQPRIGDGLAGEQDPCRRKAAGGGPVTAVARVSTAGPGVKRAPYPAASHVCGTWKPRHGPQAAASRRR